MDGGCKPCKHPLPPPITLATGVVAAPEITATVGGGNGGVGVVNLSNTLAEEFISTKVIGKIPIRPSKRPSAQFSSTRRITIIVSPLLKGRQSFSSTSVTLKSYRALH